MEKFTEKKINVKRISTKLTLLVVKCLLRYSHYDQLKKTILTKIKFLMIFSDRIEKKLTSKRITVFSL